MSCGNRFQCGLRKPTRFSFQPDKPSNPELHNENQKRLSELMKAREEMDRAYTMPLEKPSLQSINQTPQTAIQPYSEKPLSQETINKNSSYTPWKTPSSGYT